MHCTGGEVFPCVKFQIQFEICNIMMKKKTLAIMVIMLSLGNITGCSIIQKEIKNRNPVIVATKETEVPQSVIEIENQVSSQKKLLKATSTEIIARGENVISTQKDGIAYGCNDDRNSEKKIDEKKRIEYKFKKIEVTKNKKRVIEQAPNAQISSDLNEIGSIGVSEQYVVDQWVWIIITTTMKNRGIETLEIPLNAQYLYAIDKENCIYDIGGEVIGCKPMRNPQSQSAYYRKLKVEEEIEVTRIYRIPEQVMKEKESLDFCMVLDIIGRDLETVAKEEGYQIYRIPIEEAGGN